MNPRVGHKKRLFKNTRETNSSGDFACIIIIAGSQSYMRIKEKL